MPSCDVPSLSAFLPKVKGRQLGAKIYILTQGRNGERYCTDTQTGPILYPRLLAL